MIFVLGEVFAEEAEPVYIPTPPQWTPGDDDDDDDEDEPVKQLSAKEVIYAMFHPYFTFISFCKSELASRK